MKAEQTIYIIGAGAIGKALAVFLKMAGKPVIILRGSVDDGSTITEHYKIETAGGTVYQADIEIATLSTFNALNGIVVLASKSFGNERLATALKSKTGSSPIVLLQNGLGVERPFISSGFTEVYRCVLFVTSQSISADTIRFKPVTICPIGIENGSGDTLNYIVSELSTPHFQFKAEENIQQVIWKKAIANCVFNSVCPLLGADNGIFYRNSAALEIARTVISECTTIAKLKGVLINADEVEESLLKISRSSDGQLISTLQDINHKRRTEIDTLNFEIVRIAESFNKGDLVSNTRLLGELTRLKADINL